MSTITLHNESDDQLRLITALLKEMKINFDLSVNQSVYNVSEAEEVLIRKGLEDSESGRIVSSDEAGRRAKEFIE